MFGSGLGICEGTPHRVAVWNNLVAKSKLQAPLGIVGRWGGSGANSRPGQTLPAAACKLQVRRAAFQTAGAAPPWTRPVRLSGTGKQHKAIQNSHAELGFLSGLRPPLRTVSGSEKSYRPRKFRWRQISGERWARSSLRTSLPSAGPARWPPACRWRSSGRRR